MSSHWAGAVPPGSQTGSELDDTASAKVTQRSLNKKELSPLHISSYDPLICPRHGRKPTPVDTNAHTLTHPPTQLPVVACSTYNRAKQTQTGGVALPGVSRALLPGRRQRYTQADGPVKLAPPRLHSDHGAKVCLVAQQLCNQLIRNWLSLRSKRK